MVLRGYGILDAAHGVVLARATWIIVKAILKQILHLLIFNLVMSSQNINVFSQLVTSHSQTPVLIIKLRIYSHHVFNLHFVPSHSFQKFLFYVGTVDVNWLLNWNLYWNLHRNLSVNVHRNLTVNVYRLVDIYNFLCYFWHLYCSYDLFLHLKRHFFLYLNVFRHLHNLFHNPFRSRNRSRNFHNNLDRLFYYNFSDYLFRNN